MSTEENGRRTGYSERTRSTGLKSECSQMSPASWLPTRYVSCRYPKQQRLLALKKAAVAAHALPPTFLPYSELLSLQGSKFDVILIDPPFSSSFTWDDLQELPVPSLAADPSFVFMWVGSGYGEGLERGREILAKWGFRRCEDIVWVKTNNMSNKGPGVRRVCCA